MADLGVLVIVARCASLPHAPYDSTTRGMHVHPSSQHLASLAECFLSSVAATATDPAVRPTSERKDGLSGEVTLQACHRANYKLEARVSAGRVCWSSRPSPLPAPALALMQVQCQV